MFGIGIPELVIIIIVALLVVGPSKLPELAKSLGKALGEFRRMADDMKDTLQEEMARTEEKKEPNQQEGASKEAGSQEEAPKEEASKTDTGEGHEAKETTQGKERETQSADAAKDGVNPNEQKTT